MKRLFNHIKQNAALCSVLSCVFMLSNTAIAQYNLVNNYSFEDYTQCPKKLNNPLPPPWYLAGKYLPLSYLNACSNDIYTSVPYNSVGNPSYQYARTGQAYSFADYYNGSYRQYIQSKLKDSLRNKKFYYIEYFVNIPNTLKFACNNVALLLTNSAVYVDTIVNLYGVLPANPQVYNYGNPVLGDTVNWTKVSAVYKAQGGEQFITLGNFKTNAQTTLQQIQPNAYYGAGYYIDDVSVIPLDSMCLKADAGRDTTIAVGDSVFIGSYTNGIDTIKWYNANGQLLDSVQPGFWVKPNATGSYMYVLQQTVNSCYSRDTVWVNVNPLPLKMVGFTALYQPPLTPPQEGNVLLQWQTANEVNVSHYSITKSIDGKEFTVIGKVKANNRSSNEYSFTDKLKTEALDGKTVYYRIVGVDFDGQKQYSQVKSVALKVKSEGISVYPNPTNGIVHIVGSNIKEVKLINYLGQQIATGTNLSNDAIIINTKNLSKGLYIVQIITKNNEVKSEKLVVE